MTELVLRNDINDIAFLTLNRPRKLNALSPELFLDLRRHIDHLHDDNHVACVVIKGAGRSFCAGADLGALKEGVVTEDRELRSETIQRIGDLPQAVIASVQGHCYTGGLELALAADIIVAGSDARFCDTHAKVGIVPRWGLSARLPRRVGPALAKRLSITGDVLDAQAALEISLCDYVVPASELESATMELAGGIAGQSSTSIAAIKHLYTRALDVPLSDALDYERAYTKTNKVEP